MTNKDKPTLIQTEVMAKIHQGSVKMKPRIYFTILWLLGISASIVAGLLIAYIIDMLVYVVRIQTSSTPAYRARQNLSEALASFPWWTVVLFVFIFAVSVWLMKKYSRIYRYKISTVIFGFLAISFLLGIGMSYTNIGLSDKQKNPLNSSQQHNNGGTGRGSSIRNN